ncbi:predicted protein [Postia placenta Mad-698-R]|uniref:Uncharacterized protein n=1 Tax=Postia placenta MAD-698-R-SB12 TaxID=670580 RepID=A0A1X6MUQ3_9APHY|nr:hypothetical protein POSPLADRAFT_1148705 [Postia placenta MAD-698-R-SB12]EED84464.1 predicted protein [Postia placenta Mad-698-R]OSX60097.1 hypothetical protein POSPLADRAFT_1148705 [Postia placenta MAD-698-R-SB12]
MATPADEDDIDVETLQAQVDMSMAFTQNLVSSWMTPSKGKLPSSSSHLNDEKELEEYMRRPPRLGVGAAVPESTSMFGRDAARLKNKLTGNNAKKRGRDEDRDVVARVDVFAKEGKGKKAKKDAFSGPSTSKAQVTSPKASHSNQNVEVAARPHTPDPADGERSPSPASRDQASPKKKKKKHRVIDLTESPAPSPRKTPAEQVADGPSKMSLSANRHEGDVDANRSSSKPDQAKLFKPFGGPPIPLLNLSGPPANTAEDASPASPKKKRRRKKKKKKPVAEVAVDDDSGSDE